MNRRDLLKSSATLAAAVVGCIPQEKQPVAGPQATRLSGDCRVEVAVTDSDGWVVINETWKPMPAFGRPVKITKDLLDVSGWSCRTVE